MEVGVGLVDRLQVGLFGDALARDRGPELVVHHLDLLVDQDVGELERRVRDRVFDDPVGELVACPVEGVALESLLDVRSQRVDVGKVTERPDEILVEIGQDLRAQLAQLDREMGLLAGELGLRVVVREGDVELGRAADLEADEICSRSPG